VQARCSFFGVRGPLTRDRLGLAADTVIGDPGLLAPLFHAPIKLQEYANRSVCISHIHDAKSDSELLRLSGADLVLRPEIPATEHALRQILDKIASASFVLSGALHGAIPACAYGRPFSFWDNGRVDIPFKWQDFASSVNIPCVFAGNVAEGWRTYQDFSPQMRIPPLSPILEVRPFFIRPSALLRALCHDGRLRMEQARTRRKFWRHSIAFNQTPCISSRTGQLNIGQTATSSDKLFKLMRAVLKSSSRTSLKKLRLRFHRDSKILLIQSPATGTTRSQNIM
jgi:Polysaccharide pyruvyl transferase